ncbi:hypothetical protein C0Q70_13658 [Pomacea canaliculata]|uniref:RecA family profile 1 domain-containing protein n=1 Tax=Pomacea canaliculata TaxID=400727 RepID=A0A2T7NXV5_POMCA|nr:hypothetical protein C0Q70_13658 [Pomacea canaliculata]
MNKSLGEIDINPRIAAAAKRAGLTTAGSVITLSGPESSICCTEDTFPSKRFQQLDGLNSFVQKKLPLLLARKSVQLVVIDSVAALFRCHYESHNLVARAKHLASLATQLRKLAVQYNVAVVCVNQLIQMGLPQPSSRDIARVVQGNNPNNQPSQTGCHLVYGKGVWFIDTAVTKKSVVAIFEPGVSERCWHTTISLKFHLADLVGNMLIAEKGDLSRSKQSIHSDDSSPSSPSRDVRAARLVPQDIIPDDDVVRPKSAASRLVYTTSTFLK